MPNIRQPRHGSMQFWPRVRARRPYARVRAWPSAEQARPLAFAGYKVGMTHAVAAHPGKASHLSGEDIAFPVTVVAAPPLRVVGLRAYRRTAQGWILARHMLLKPTKHLGRRTRLPKKAPSADFSAFDPASFNRLVLQVATQPHLIQLKKTPEIFEIALGGAPADQLAAAKSLADKDLAISDVFAEGALVDIHAVTKGKGYQGPVKRFGIALRPHKSEKTRRGPGSLGGWSGQGHVMYRVAHAGQMGYHQRTQHNNQILRIGAKPDDINVKGGFRHFGLVRGEYVLLKGSAPGPARRLLILTAAVRRPAPPPLPTIKYLSLASKQGV